MNRIFNRLLNVEGTVVEDARIVDSPLRPELVLEVHPGLRGGARVADDGRQPEDHERFPACMSGVRTPNACSTGSASSPR